MRTSTSLSSRRPGARSAFSLTSLALVGSLALAGCSDSTSPESADSPDSQSTAEGSTLSGQWPLTGLPAEGEAPKHPVMVVKIDNTGSSSPQVGLGEADLVAEELVEGGSTRLAVFYYSQVPRQGRPRAVDARHRHRHRRARRRGARGQRRGPADGDAGSKDAGIKTFTEGATGLLPRQRPLGAVQPVHGPAEAREDPEVRRRPRELPAVGHRGGLPQGAAGRAGSRRRSPAGHTTNWQYQRRPATSTSTARRRRATSSPRHRARAAGARSATPATRTPRATRCRRRSSPARARRWSSTTADGAGDLVQERASTRRVKLRPRPAS